MTRFLAFAALLVGLFVGLAAAAPAVAAEDPFEPFLAPETDSLETPGPNAGHFLDAAAVKTAIDACLASAAAASAALAEDPSKEIDAPIRDAADCVGGAAAVCLGYASNQSTAGMVGCVASEAGVWEGVMTAAFSDAIEKLQSDDARNALRAAQDAWAEYRNATCAIWDHVFEGGTMARPIAANCVMEKTAARAIERREFAAGLVR